MKKSFIVVVFVVGVILGILLGQTELPVSRFQLAEKLCQNLQENFPEQVQEVHMDQIKHAATYAYASRSQVISWYYRYKWQYQG